MTNPGSDEAIEQGCKCAVYDNNHGNMPDGNYWITDICPLHGTSKEYVYACSACAFQSLDKKELEKHLCQHLPGAA